MATDNKCSSGGGASLPQRRLSTASSPSSSSASSAAFQIVFPISHAAADRNQQNHAILHIPGAGHADMAPPSDPDHSCPAVASVEHHRRSRKLSSSISGGKMMRSQSVGQHSSGGDGVEEEAYAAAEIHGSRGAAEREEEQQQQRHSSIEEVLLMQGRRHGSSSKTTARSFNGMLCAIFSCMNPCKSVSSSSVSFSEQAPLSPISANRKVAALLEISKQQQMELANKQDTIDMLEFQLEQMRSMEKQIYMEEEQYAAAFRRLQIKDTNESCASCSNDTSSSSSSSSSAMAKKPDGLLPRSRHSHPLRQQFKARNHGSQQQGRSGGDDSTDIGGLGEEDSTYISGGGGDDSTDINGGEGNDSADISGGGGEDSTTTAGGVAPISVSPDRTLITLTLFEMATVRARFAIRSLAKSLIKQLEAAGYPVAKTLSEMEPEVAFPRKEHAVYALESRINRAMYQSFENDNYDESGITQILNPAARCAARLAEFQRMKMAAAAEATEVGSANYVAEFRRFCERKARGVWEGLCLWGGGGGVSLGAHCADRDSFTAAFLDAAKGVWLLHKLAYSIQPHVTILRVGKGMVLETAYVEAVTELAQGLPCAACGLTTVDFLVSPGFQALDKVIKCLVYPHVHCQRRRHHP